MAAAFGYFGKFPALGDFVRGGVRRPFIEAWDPFLQSGLLASRADLGEESWRAAYQSAPIWRFALGERVIAGGPYFGVMMPSQDAVGRLFPLTLVAAGSPPALNDALFVPLEDAALNMLDSLRSKPELETMLAALPDAATAGEIAADQSLWLSAPGEGYGAPLGLSCAGLPDKKSFNTLLNQDKSDWSGEIITGEFA